MAKTESWEVSDELWQNVEPLVPKPPPRRARQRYQRRPGGGRKPLGDRQIFSGLVYVLRTGCQWKALPKDLPPKSTAHYYFMLWDWDGTLERIHHALYVAVREQAGREASPTVAIIDSQSGKAAQKGALHSTRRALMRARRSRAANAISSSIRSVCC